MLISVKVIARARQEKIEKQPDGSYKVWVRTVPEKGKANQRVAELLAGFFKKPKTACVVIKGKSRSVKSIEII